MVMWVMGKKEFEFCMTIYNKHSGFSEFTIFVGHLTQSLQTE